MRQKVFDDGGEEGLSSTTMIDTMDTELALELSRAGGLGLAAVMVEAYEARAAAEEAETRGAAAPGGTKVGGLKK
jgi:Rod binding domain-containing protein